MNRNLVQSQNASRSCRICLDNDNSTDLISPCLCTGGSAYVHRKCLDTWRSMNRSGYAFTRCDVCRFDYVIEPVVDDPAADKKRLLIFRLLVTRDITLIILLVQALIIGMTFLLQVADKNSNDIKHFYPDSMSSFGIYYLSSIILFFALLGFFGLIAACCGWITKDDHDDRCNCFCYPCICISPNCHGNHDCGGGGGGAGVLVIIVVIFAIIGVFVGIILGGIIIRQIIKRHAKKLWLRQEAKKYIVKDFQGRTNELQNRLTRQPSPQPSVHKEINNDRTLKTPSAPVEVITLTTYDTQ